MDRLLNFDQNAWDSISMLLSKIDSYKMKWEITTRFTPNELHELKQMATVQSIGSSTRIEGATLSDAEISKLITHLEIGKLNSRDEQEVGGYFKTLDLILDQFKYVELTENSIKGLHKQLMQFSIKDEFHRGKYKQLSNQVVANYADGEQRVIFKTTDPTAVADEMQQAIAWTSLQLKNGEKHPLIIIGAFVYEFLSIHPFQDGNGRLSRLLSTLLLLRSGYDFIPFISLEHEIENRKAEYYQCLMHAQQHRQTDKESISWWMEYFLGALHRLTLKLDNKADRVQELPSIYLNTRQAKIMEIIGETAPLGVKSFEEAMPDVSRNTIKYDLKRLVEYGMLRRRGKGRGTVYM